MSNTQTSQTHTHARRHIFPHIICNYIHTTPYKSTTFVITTHLLLQFHAQGPLNPSVAERWLHFAVVFFFVLESWCCCSLYCRLSVSKIKQQNTTKFFLPNFMIRLCIRCHKTCTNKTCKHSDTHTLARINTSSFCACSFTG